MNKSKFGRNFNDEDDDDDDDDEFFNNKKINENYDKKIDYSSTSSNSSEEEKELLRIKKKNEKTYALYKEELEIDNINKINKVLLNNNNNIQNKEKRNINKNLVYEKKLANTSNYNNNIDNQNDSCDLLSLQKVMDNDMVVE